MVNPGSPNTGQSSTSSLDGEFMTDQQFLDLVKNQRFISSLEKNPGMLLPLKLEESFVQLVDLTLQFEELDLVNTKKRRIKFKSSHPAKRARYATSVAMTPNHIRGICYNCSSTDHHANKCPRPLSCRYCKGPGHLIPTCPKLQSKRKGKLNALPTSSDPSS